MLSIQKPRCDGLKTSTYYSLVVVLEIDVRFTLNGSSCKSKLLMDTIVEDVEPEAVKV